ncbi:hypothetical protein HA402_004566 [Bradysia odoriphaga]|nr:hypothetical protein HA402_004566 [Bradysia odoriphaga]
MPCVLFKYYVAIVVTIFVRFPIEIGCCSMTTSAMIDLMYQNPNYASDPCYIKWKAAQDADLAQIWARQDDLQRRAHEYNRRRMENEAIERANRQDSYSHTFSVAQSKSIYGISSFNAPQYLIREPELIKRIGVKDFDYFEDHNSFASDKHDRLWGNNLFFTKGAKWRNNRAMVSPAFTGSKMRQMFELVADFHGACRRILFEAS